PLVAGVMMRGVTNAIEDGIAQPDVGRLHVDLRPQSSCAVRKFTRFHAREQIEILVDGAIAKRTIFSEPAIFIDLFRGHVAHVSLTVAYEPEGKFVDLLEVIGSEERSRRNCRLLISDC